MLIQGDKILPHQVEVHAEEVIKKLMTTIRNMTEADLKSRIKNIVDKFERSNTDIRINAYKSLGFLEE